MNNFIKLIYNNLNLTMMNINNLKKKLLYRSKRRGTKEMDLLLGSFVKKYVDCTAVQCRYVVKFRRDSVVFLFCPFFYFVFAKT